MAKTAQDIVTIKSLSGQLFQATDEALTPDGVKVVQGTSGQIYVDRSSRTLNTSIADIRLMGGTGVADANQNIVYITKDYGVVGQWVVDSTDTTSTDDTGTVLVTAGGQRLKRKYKGPVHTQWFDLAGDGATDDTTKLAAVINNFTDIVVNKGTYLITVATTAPLLPQSDATIKFDTGAKIQVAANALTGYILLNINGKSNVVIDGFVAIGDKDTHTGSTGESGILVEVLNSSNVTINNVDLSKSWGDGIYISGPAGTPSENITISNFNIYDCRRNGISITNAKRVIITDGYLHDIEGTDPQSGIDIEPNTGQICEDIVLNNIQSYDNTGNGIENHGDNVVITNFICRNNGRSNILLSSCENVKIQGGVLDTCVSHGIDGKVVNGLSVTNVDIRNSTIDGFSLLNCDGKLVIAFCNISDNTRDGLVVNSSSSGKPDLLLFGNTIERNIQGMLIYEKSNISHNIIRNNSGHGIQRSGRTGTENSIISNNKIYGNAYSGIRLEWNGDIVHHNNVHENGTNATVGWYNIHIEGTAADNTIENNKLRRGTATNKPEYDIYVDATAGENIIYKNDCGDDDNKMSINAVTLFDYGILAFTPVSADYTVKTYDTNILIDSSAGAIAITLLTASYKLSQRFKKISDDTNTITITAATGETIDGVASKTLSNQYDVIEITSDGTENYVTTNVSATPTLDAVLTAGATTAQTPTVGGLKVTGLTSKTSLATDADGNLIAGAGVSSDVLAKNTASLSGDDSTTEFTISSAFGSTPGNIQITPTSEAAAMANFYISAKDSAGFTIKAAGAIPPAGSANLTFNWVAYKS